jgi:serine/threonine protein kinase
MPTEEPCRAPEELRARLAGPLTDAERSALAVHLEACPRCRDAAESFLAERGGSGATAVASGATHPWVAALLRELRGGRPESHRTVATPSLEEVTLAAPPPAQAATIAYPPPSVPAPGVPQPLQLAHYRIIRELGSGGMGVVYLADDTKLERRVALKVLRADLAAVPVNGQRFLREAKAAAKIENDHIVTIYQVDEADGVPFLAMQFLQGESMECWLQRGQRATPAQAAQLGRETALGLTAAHEQGLVHRDIKPANLWLEAPKGRVKILDFGLARSTAGDANLTLAGAIVGTPSYMAPEQARAAAPDARADLFSLGVVLFRLCAGRLPFKGDDPMSCMISAATDTPPAARDLNPEVPQALSDLIARLVEKDPASRPQSAAEVAERLAHIEDDLRNVRLTGMPSNESLSVKSAHPSMRLLPERRMPRHLRWTLAGLALVVAVGGLAVVLLRPATGTLQIRADGADFRVIVSRDGQVIRTVDDFVSPLRLPAGLYTLEPQSKPGVPQGKLELTTDQGTHEARVERGATVVVTVRRVAPPAVPAATAAPAKPPDHGWEPPALAVPFRSAPAPGAAAEVRCLGFSADGRSLRVGYRTRVQTYDAELRKTDILALRLVDPDYKEGVACMALSTDGGLLALRTQGGKLAVWDLPTRKETTVARDTKAGVLEFSADGSRLAVGDGKTVRVREGLGFAKEAEVLAGHPDTVSALAFAPAGRRLAVGCVDGSVWVWDLATRKHEDQSPQPRSAEVAALAYAPGGKRIAIGRPHDAKVLFTTGARDPLSLRAQGGAIAFSPDGHWVALGDGRRLALFDLTARRRHNLPPEHADVIARVAFSPDGHAVATAGRDGSLKLWDVTSVVNGHLSLFNGRDLAGWKSYDTPAGTFVVEDGRLAATGKAPGWLLTDEDYADFELTLEYRLQAGASSGVAVRAAPQAPASYAMEIQIADDEHARTPDRPEQRTGALFDVRPPSVLNNNKVGEWNVLRLVAERRHVVVEVNGLRVVDHEIDATDLAKRPELASATGRIGLQSENGRVEFRNVVVKRLAPVAKR